MDTTLSNSPSVATLRSLEDELRRRRIWYHDVEVEPGLRTRFAEDYEANPVVRSIDGCSRELIAYVEKHLPTDLAGQSVLDLGCADGLLSFWAAKRGAKRVVGVERNRFNYDRAEFVRHAMRLDSVSFHCGGLERHCPDETFDVVLCFNLLYHLVDPLGSLHALRSRCRGTMLLSSAVDLPDDEAPLSRLDRYATGAHGVWSFNPAMVRQLLSTAGFSIIDEHIECKPGGRDHYVFVEPGEFGAHHIFEETIDQEFPIDIRRRREELRETWGALAETVDKPIALFGAGTFTPWLMEQVADIGGVEVACVLDDRIPVVGAVAGLAVRRPEDVEADALGAVVISSWHQSDVLRRRAVEVFGDRVPVVTPGLLPESS